MPTDQYGDPLPEGALNRLGTLRFGPADRVTALAFSPDSKTLASGGEDLTVRLWNPTTGKEVRRFGEHEDKIGAIGFSADGKVLASGSRAGEICFWDAATSRELRRFRGHDGAVISLAFSADGKTLVSGGTDETVRFWDMASARELRQLGGGFGPAQAIAFSPDGKLLATGGWENTVRLWDLAASKEIRQFQGHRSWVQAIAFSPNGRMLVSGSGDETVRLWEMTSGLERHRFPGHKDGVFCIAFAPDGKTLASAGADATILVWDVTGTVRDPRRPAPVPMTASQLDGLWPELASADATRAYRALWSLAAVPAQAVGLIKTRIRLLLPRNVPDLIADLNHDHLGNREKATQELERIGALCEPALREALKKSPSTEARRRLDRLLDKLTAPTPSPDTLLALRASEALEVIATPEARQVLESLAREQPPTRLAQDARAALERLKTGKPSGNR
jgi:WD40 repeat protein